MSTRRNGSRVSFVGCLAWCLGGCAVSAIRNDDDANLSLLAADAEAFGADAGQLDLTDGGNTTSPDAEAPDPDTGHDDPASADAGQNGPDTQDSGSGFGGEDAGLAQPDAELPKLPLVVDGIVHDSEWSNASWVSQNSPSNWGVTQNVLLSLGVEVRDGALWLAVRGAIEDTNAIVVYFDSTPDMGLAPSAITDQTGSLDDALSAALNTPSGFGAELAWGTRGMGLSATGDFNASVGFRGLIDTSADNLSWIDGSQAPTVCSLSACEASIPLTYLGAGTKLSVFARITNAHGTSFANQTLPNDVAESPSGVSQLLTIPR